MKRAAFDYTQLDPGIRPIVQRLHTAGFETSDSGDGVSKPADWYASGEAMAFPHVVIVSTLGRMVADAHALADLLGDGWTVEASYQTHTKSVTVLARTLDPREISSGTPKG